MASLKTHFVKLIVLTVIATLIAEVLSGSTTLTRIQYLPAQFLIYGSAAIIIREIARRRDKGWMTILLLGWAFGFLLEGMVLQSVFNPHFLNLDISFGSKWGVNWVWAMYMPGFHGIWSVTTSILLTELIFSRDKEEPWAGSVAMYIIVFIFALMCVAFHFIFFKMFEFKAPTYLFVACAVVVITLILAALKIKPKSNPQFPSKPSAWSYVAITCVTFIAGGFWYAGFATIFIGGKPAPWISLTAAPVIAGTYLLAISKIPSLSIQTEKQKLALVTGLLLSGWLFGFFATASNETDHVAQLTLLFPIAVTIYLLYRKSNKPL